MELSVGRMIADLPSAAAIVIDCLPNMNAAQVTNRTIPLVMLLRAQSQLAETPIVLAEGNFLFFLPRDLQFIPSNLIHDDSIIIILFFLKEPPPRVNG